jgi:hypothetical protein
MKHLRLFESFSEKEKDISGIIKSIGLFNWKYKINSDDTIDFDPKQQTEYSNYTINDDGTINYHNDDGIYLSGLLRDMNKLPIKFGNIVGNFWCHHNQLTSLEGSPSKVSRNFQCGYNKLIELKGAPSEVGRDFACQFNNLTSLEGGPREVGGDFFCGRNKLIDLKGAPIEVGGDFNCENNNLTSLEGAPREVGGDFHCENNNLTSLEGGPTKIGGNLYCNGNPIHSIYKLFPNHKAFMESLDYDYLRGTTIIKWKFKEALDEFNIKMPESIPGWKYI